MGWPPKWTRRQLVDGLRWRARVGAPCRDVPERYGHWQSVYGLFRWWQRHRVWPGGPGHVAGLRGCGRGGHVAGVGGLDDQPGSSACCRGSS
ncbi:transposase [Halosaccharopolyspora lacisalsi]|uniref:transposase n=1 Tax=Halosaccharopolyspora lacisalsi TaxID=1000566 RepID=UPI0015FE7BBB|nr:transposase [Halosaccharopolyspora lacisalsi]